MKKIIFSRKLVAVLVAVIMLAGTLVVPMISVASTPTEVTQLNSSNGPSTVEAGASGSLIAGKKPILAQTSPDGTLSGTYNAGFSDAALLTDGTTTTNHTDFAAYNGGTYYDTNSYIAWQLDCKAEVNGFLLYNTNTASAVNHASYEVYVADSLAALFDSANLVHTYQAADGASDNGQKVTFGTDSIKSGYYVGVKLLKACSHADTADCTVGLHCDSYRLSEIAFYGTKNTADTLGYTENAAFYSGTNYGYDTDGEYTYAKSLINPTVHPGVTISASAGGSNVATANDGNTTNQWEIWNGAPTVTITLESETKITGFSYWHNNATRKDSYEVYVGSNQATLFSGTPVYKWDASKGIRSMRQDVRFAADTAAIGKFVGIKYTDADVTVDGGQCRVAEIALWGSNDLGVYLESTDAAANETYMTENADANLISGKSFMAYTRTANLGSYSGGGNFSRLTDNTSTTNHADLYGDCAGLALAWQLDFYSNVDHFLFYNRTGSSTHEVSYEVYVSDEFNNLFDASNKVWTHVADPANFQRTQLVNLGSNVDGNFVGLLITDDGADSARISEIAFYGSRDNQKPADYTLNTTFGTQRVFDSTYTYDTNFLKGLSATTAGACSGVAKLTDGQFNECEFYDSSTAGKDTAVFSLGKKMSISAFQYWHSRTDATHKRFDSYEVYVGNEESTLFDPANKVFDWDVTAAATSFSQQIVFNADKKPEGSFIGLKFTEGSVGSTSSKYARVGEVAAWGTEIVATGEIATDSATIQAYLDSHESLIKNKTFIAAYTPGNFANIFGWGDKFERLTDNTLSTAHADIYGGSGICNATNMVWQLDYESAVSGFAVFNRANAAGEIEYEIYVGNSIETIFDAANKVYTHTRDTANEKRGQLVVLPSAVSGSFVALKITDTATTDGSVRLSEIAFFGTADTQKPVAYKLNTHFTSKAYSSEYTYNNSILKGLTATTKSGNNGIAKLNDGTFSECEIYDVATDGKNTVVFELPNTATISAMQYWHSKNGADKRYDAYEIYVGNDTETLFASANKVFGWDVVSSPLSYSQQIVFNENAKPRGSFIGIKYLEGSVGTDTYKSARVAEFAVWGDVDADTSIESFDTTVVGNYLTANASKSLIGGKKYIAAYKSTLASYSGDGNIARLTDNTSATAHADIYGNCADLHLVWQLDRYSKVDHFVFFNRANANDEASYEVYVGDTMDTLFAASNLVYTHTAVSSNVMRAQLVNLGDTVKGQFVGVIITNPGSADGSLRASEIAFYGEAEAGAESLKYQQNTLYTSKAFAQGYTYDSNILKGANAVNGSSPTAKLTDGDLTVEQGFWNAGSTQPYVTIEMSGRYYFDAIQYWHSKQNGADKLFDSYEIYVADSEAELYNAENRVYEWKVVSNPISYSQFLQFTGTEKPVGQYLGIKYTEPSVGNDSDGGARVAEVAAWGTAAPSLGGVAPLENGKAAEMHDDNLIAGKLLNTQSATSFHGGSAGYKAAMTDGVAGSHYDIYTQQNSVVYWSLGGSYKVESVAVWQGHPTLRVKFEIYVGNDTATLFNAENKVGNNRIDASTNGQLITLSTQEDHIGRYVGLKVVGTNGGDYSCRFSEVGVYGVLNNAAYTVDTAVDFEIIPELLKDNELGGRIPTLNEGWTGYGETLSGKLSDGLTPECQMYSAGNGSNYFYFDLEYPTVITELGTWYSNVTRRTGYEIYIGDDTATLFDVANKVFANDGSDTLSMGQMVFLSQPITARYVGWLITDPDTLGTGDSDQARLREVYVKGTPVMDTVQVDHEVDETVLADVDNLFEGLVPTLGGTAVDSTAAALLTDKAVAGGGITVNSGDLLVYNLGRNATVNSAILSTDEVIDRYDVYVASTLEDLFKAVNRVAIVEGAVATDFIQQAHFFAEDKLFVGFKIVSANNVTVNEAAATGELYKFLVDYPAKNTTTTNYGDDNLIEGLVPSMTDFDGISFTQNSSKSSPLFVGNANHEGPMYYWLYDDKVGERDHTDVYGFKGGTITYDLGVKYDISTVALYNHRERYLEGYEIYVGNNESTLYTPENLVATFENKNQSWAQEFNFMAGEEAVGRFVGIRLESANYMGDNDLRISEIAVLGTPHIAVDTELSQTANVTGYSYIGSRAYKLTDAQFTNEQRINFVNSANTTPIVINDNGGILSFVVDLGASMNISKMLYSNPADLTKSVKSMKVYTADVQREVWDEEKLFFTYNRAATDGQLLTFDNPFKARYVRIEITDTGTTDGTFNLNYVSFIGLDDQKMDVVNLLYKHPSSKTNYYAQNNETFEYASFFSSYNAGYLCDNATTVGSAFWGPSYENESINIVFNFEDSKAVNQLKVSTLLDELYKVEDMDIYLAKSLSSVMSEKAIPVASYRASGTDGFNATAADTGDGLTETLTFDFAYTEATYIRLRVNGGANRLTSRDNKMLVMTEVQARGIDTSNAGGGDASSASASFIDSETKIAVDFGKLNADDVYSDLVKMTITKKPCTEEMKAKLKEYDFAPITELYVAEFYDYLGNKVTDFEGRSVTVYIPTAPGTMAYLAGYYEGQFDLLNSGFDGDYVTYTFNESEPILQFLLAEYVEPSEEEEIIPDEPVDEPTDEPEEDTPVIEEPEEEPEEEPDEEVSKPKKKKKYKMVITEGLDTWVIILIVAGAAIVLGGLTWFLIVFLKKKKNKEPTQEN